eukprot:3940311-Rhodomonas_salina.4
MSGTEIASAVCSLRVCYAMSGTEQRMVLPDAMTVCLTLTSKLPGTLCYLPTRFLCDPRY